MQKGLQMLDLGQGGKMVARAYNMTVNQYQKPGSIIRENTCFAFVATNIGNTTAFINGILLYPGTVGTTKGESITITGNLLDIYKGNIDLAFGAGAGPNIEIIQLYYLEQY